MADRRKPQLAPGPAHTESRSTADFTLPAALYYDAIFFYHLARIADDSNDANTCNRFKRSAVLAAFCFFETQLNQIAFAYAKAHKDTIGQIERDVLEEMETVMDDRGDIVRRNKIYRTESRFAFLSYFLSGQDFDRSGQLWQRFQYARELRDQWTHPKPPFDTWSLGLPDVYSAITVVHDMFIKLAEMMNINPPLWLQPVEEILNHMKQPSENLG